MGSIFKKLKKLILIVLIIVVVVFLCIITCGAAGVGLAAGAFASGGFAAAAAAAGAYLVSQAFITYMIVLCVGYVVMTTIMDKKKRKAMNNASKIAKQGYKDVNDYFDQMKEDSYHDYNGPSVGLEFPHDIEVQHDKVGEDSSPRIEPAAFAIAALGAYGIYVLNKKDDDDYGQFSKES